MKIVYAPRALRDIDGILAYIHKGSPRGAHSVATFAAADRLRIKLARIARQRFHLQHRCHRHLRRGHSKPIKLGSMIASGTAANPSPA
jgi:plasmid stabilization system protein ParE